MIRTTGDVCGAVAAMVLGGAVLVGASAPAAAYSKVVVASFGSAVDIATAPGHADHLYVAEQSGLVRLIVSGSLLKTPFLDISSLVNFSGEQGLLSVAFPPDHATTGRFYVQFSNSDGDVEIDEYKRSSTKPRTADPASRRKLLVVRHRDAGNHNGGRLQFDAAGHLFISIGDGGATPQYAPDLSRLLGKILRIDPKPAGAKPYTVPADNPFVGQSGKRGEIWAYGFRNPWRWTLVGSTMTIGDVGQSSWEEVDLVSIDKAKGVDFGWPHWEGRTVYDSGTTNPKPLRFPAFVYSHDAGRCAIVGGTIVAAPDLPKLKGRYIYGDYCTGELRSFVPDAAKNTATGDAGLGITASGLRGIGTDAAGKVYFTDGSTLWRLAP